jgi:hypothetical protein
MKFLRLALPFSLLAIVFAATEFSPLKDETAFGASSFMQKSYELRCRGGGLKFNSTSGRTLSTGEQMMNMTLDFSAGTQGAGSYRTLNPGQCSWVDRGFRNGEPTQIRLEIVSFGQLGQSRHGSPVDRSPTAAENYPDAQNVPQYLSSSDHYWTFWVYNTANGYLQSTSHKSFKPLKTLPGGARVPPPVRSGSGNVNESL